MFFLIFALWSRKLFELICASGWESIWRWADFSHMEARGVVTFRVFLGTLKPDFVLCCIKKMLVIRAKNTAEYIARNLTRLFENTALNMEQPQTNYRLPNRLWSARDSQSKMRLTVFLNWLRCRMRAFLVERRRGQSKGWILNWWLKRTMETISGLSRIQFGISVCHASTTTHACIQKSVSKCSTKWLQLSNSSFINMKLNEFLWTDFYLVLNLDSRLLLVFFPPFHDFILDIVALWKRIDGIQSEMQGYYLQPRVFSGKQ